MVTGLGFNGITTMQEMTSSICSSATLGLEGRLRDTRDDKVYWVGKLKDNNCWMTQNLDLDLSKSKKLTNTDSDVSSSGYTPPADTQSETITKFPSDSDLTFSFDPGEYVYTKPTTPTSCGSSGVTSLSQCTSKGWEKLDDIAMYGDSTWSATDVTSFYRATSYIATDGITICNKEANSYFGDMNSDYIPCRIYYGPIMQKIHYSIGNYYSYTVAAAGYTGTSTAPNSICPKGWRLPTGGSSGEFYGLLNGLSATQITVSPYYFVYGGIVNSSSLSAVGSVGYYWSSTANLSTFAYTLYFYTSVNPSGYSDRYIGHSARCVAR